MTDEYVECEVCGGTVKEDETWFGMCLDCYAAQLEDEGAYE